MKLGVRTIAFAALILACACFEFSNGNAALQALPNHHARLHIIEDVGFNHGQSYDQDFHVQVVLPPCLTGDLFLALRDHLVGTDWVARLWIGEAVLLLPLGTSVRRIQPSSVPVIVARFEFRRMGCLSRAR